MRLSKMKAEKQRKQAIQNDIKYKRACYQFPAMGIRANSD